MTNYPKDVTEYWKVISVKYPDDIFSFALDRTRFYRAGDGHVRTFDAGNFYLSREDAQNFVSAIEEKADDLFSAQKERLDKLIEEGKL